MATLATLTVRLTADAGQLKKDLARAQGISHGFTKGLQTMGKAALGLGLGVATAAIGGFAAVVSSTLPLATEFQSQLTGLQIAASSSGLGFDDLHDVALAVGGDMRLMGVSATGAAAAMTGLYKAGLTTAEIFGDVNAYMNEGAELGGALRAAIDLAAASELDMVQASDLGATVLATFGSELETAEERANFVNTALDNTVKAADASVAEVSDLAAAIRVVGPTASALGIPIQDVNNALAILSTRGITGAEAGTALKSMFTNLQRPTKEVIGTLEALGVSLYDAQGVFVGLPNLIEQFSESLNGTVSVMTTVGGRTAAQNDLLKEARKRYDSLTKRVSAHTSGIKTMSDSALKKANVELAASSDIIEKLSAIQGTAVASTKKLTDEERNLAIQTVAGTYGMNALNTLVAEGPDGYRAMAEATANAAGIQEQAAAKAGTFAGKMEALEGTIETLKIGIGEAFLPVATQLLGWISEIVAQHGPQIVALFGTALPSAIEAATTWVTNLVTQGQALWQTISAVGRPIQDVNNALAILSTRGIAGAEAGAALESMFTNLQRPTKEVIGTLEALQPVVEQIVGWIVGWIGQNVKLQDVLIALGVAVASVIIPALASVLIAVAPVLLVFGLVVAAVVLLRQAWESNFLGIQEKAAAVWGFLQVFIPAAIEAIRSFVTTTITEIKTWWAENGDEILAKAQAVWTAIQTVIETVMGAVQYVIATVSLAISGDWYAFGEGLRTIWDTVWAAINTIISTAWRTIKATVGKLIESIKTKFSDVDWRAVGRGIIDGIKKGIKNGVGALKDAVKAAAQAALDAARGFLGIKSPSSLFAMEVGRPITEGMARGMLDIRPLERAAEALGMAAVGAVQGASGTGGGGITFVTVVMDPRDVTDTRGRLDIESLAYQLLQEKLL